MDILSKVKRHPAYADDDTSKQESVARDLVDPVKIKDRFAHLLDMRPYLDNIRDGDDCDLLHTLEVDKHREQQKMDAAQAGYLPVKLFLSKLRRGTPPAAGPLTTLLRFKYGPLHAGLIVGNISIEWDDSSLIVPLPEPEVHESDFVAHVEDRGSYRRQCGGFVKDMSLANRRNMGTPAKLQIIYNTRDEKERLLERLTDVIIKYNKTKKYSVFSCNCQHFVTDALQALRIRDAPQFEGNLGQYFNALKKGKVAGVQFESHIQLDDYVRAHIKTLGRNEKEYLLCLYFQYHAAELGILTPEEQDVWKCIVESCQCDELDYLVEQECLEFHDFSRQQSIAATPPAVSPGARQLSLPAVREEDEGEEPVEVKTDAAEGGNDTTDHAFEQFLDPTDSKERQGQRLDVYSLSGYSRKVMAKLRAHPEYRDKSEADLMRHTEILSEREKFREAYLSDLVINETGADVVQEVSLEESMAPLSEQELKARASHRFEKLFNINMNLVIHACNIGDSKTAVAKAPVKLGLQVGNFVYEWNESGLVIPSVLHQVESRPRLLSPVLQKSAWCGVVGKEKENVEQSIEKTIQQNDYSMQIKLHVELTKKRDQLLVAFIDTVVRYNRQSAYSARSCNNATFLAEALKSLGVKNPGKLLSKSIKEHIDQLKSSRSISRKPMTTHKELDTIVAEMAEDSLSKEDTEYLIAKYYLLHVAEWDERSSWQCSVDSCGLSKLEILLTNLTTITTT